MDTGKEGELPLRERAVGICEALPGDGPAESRLGLVGDTVLGVCCRLPDQEEVVDDAFFG